MKRVNASDVVHISKSIIKVLARDMPEGFNEDDRLNLIFNITNSLLNYCETGKRLWMMDERSKNLQNALLMEEKNATH